MNKVLLSVLCMFTLSVLQAQPGRWQQKVSYDMDVQLNVETNILTGKQQITYWNNSPDTLDRVFFHLYWNAFQPNSSMDVRSRELGKLATRQDRKGNPVMDWDRRVKDTIMKLKPSETGYQQVKKVIINGRPQRTLVHETILEVIPDKAILPGSKTIIALEFEAQVPVQIRRAGRDNAEGVRYSMSQWYPKLVEYDQDGWHPQPYIAREFYGVWGDYNVKITLDDRYMVAATGVLKNAQQPGYGYAVPGVMAPAPNTNPNRTFTWNFAGSNIHDFVFTADPDYKQVSAKPRKGLTLRVVYQSKNPKTDSAWQNVLWMAGKVLPFIEQQFGRYPWPEYAFIQGGDGGMEYAMATLMNGPGIETAVHEWMHSWYQHLFGTNESLYPWMDEGFATYAEDLVMDHYLRNFANQSPFINDSIRAANLKAIAERDNMNPAVHAGSYKRYYALQKSPYEEPMSTHADHYNTNFAYTEASYFKGAVFLEQLGYIIGAKVRDSVLLDYYRSWGFRHPRPDDFLRLAEKRSGLVLDWYKEYWVNSTKSIDYTIGNIDVVNGGTRITLRRLGKMPMPIDVLLTFKDGSREMHYIPLDLMYGEKQAEDSIPRVVHEAWRWTHTEYSFETKRNLRDLKSVEIDPSGRMADTDRRALVIPD
ncbi:MAG TPA: M1 family metallopeptidase [Chitinophagaceae bacterium]